jgi:hypothetical protein
VIAIGWRVLGFASGAIAITPPGVGDRLDWCCVTLRPVSGNTSGAIAIASEAIVITNLVIKRLKSKAIADPVGLSQNESPAAHGRRDPRPRAAAGGLEGEVPQGGRAAVVQLQREGRHRPGPRHQAGQESPPQFLRAFKHHTQRATAAKASNAGTATAPSPTPATAATGG